MTSVGARRAMIVVAWVVATALAAGVAWWAVSVVGHGPSASEASVRSQAEVAAELAARRATAAAATPSATPTQTPTPTATTDATPTTPPPPPSETVARTWDVAGGQVSASCRGTEIGLLGATPLDGWSMEVKHDGPEELEVEFRRGEAETGVKARCVDGTPQMGGVED